MGENSQVPGAQDQQFQPTFIDLFAGCGGLSLGLMQAGWQGLFAVEKSPMVFETLRYNLIDQEKGWHFNWPEWLPRKAVDIQVLIKTHKEQLEQLKGISLLAGGPPCQGYSRAGKRRPDDERNHLLDHYLSLADLLEPKMLLIENVSDFAKTFDKTERGTNGVEIQGELYNADQELQATLIEMGYLPQAQYTVMAKDFGVPQLRPRYILIAIQKDLIGETTSPDFFEILYSLRGDFLSSYGLPQDREITLSEAISDLLKSHGHVDCIEPRMKRFRQGLYGSIKSEYQKLMRKKRNGEPIEQGQVADSHRFTNHKPETIERFRRIIAEFRPGIQLREEQIKSLGLNKHRIAPLAADEACHTLTSLPDDLVHYSEPRIPTVREYARIQSFPDWFEFKLNYTTGGDRRRVEVPRYTQAANAVPPLLAEAIGRALLQVYQALLNGAQAKDEEVKPLPTSSEPVQLELSLE